MTTATVGGSQRQQTAEDEPFAAVLRRLRLAAGLSQEALAERAGLSAKAVAQLETGKRTEPRAETLRLLSEALQLEQAERAALAAAARRRPSLPAVLLPMTTSQPVVDTLPTSTTALLGREHEIAEVVARLERLEVRLVTLTGPGGVGKTRLALEVARKLLGAFAGDVTFVQLAAVRDPDLVVATIARALDVPEESHQSVRATLIDALRPRHHLLLLDNFEQVLDAAPDIGELVVSCPDVTVLVTSRERLRLTDERVVPVEPLALPDVSRHATPDEVGASAAVRLLLERSRQVAPGFELTDANAADIGDLCRRLDGLPLAIELAAGRTASLPLPLLLDGLRKHQSLLAWGPRDAPPRLRTMRNAIAWSHDLLDPTERRVFRQVAVFVGGFTLAGAEATVVRGRGEEGVDGRPPDDHPEADGDSPDLLETLSSLLEKHLIRRLESRAGEPRFGMLETIRDFALHQLALSREGELVRAHHLAYFVALAVDAEAELAGPNQGVWLDRLMAEVDNLRAAFAWAVERRDPASALRLSSSLWRFWTGRGLRRDGRDWLERALAIDVDLAPELRAKALYRLGAFAIDRADYDEAVARLEASLAISRKQGNLAEVADALGALGVVASELGDYTRTRLLFEEAYAIRRDKVPDDRTGIALSLFNLAHVARDEYDFERAADFYARALAAWNELGDHGTVAYILLSQGISLRHMGDSRSASESTEQALEIFRELGDDFGVGAATVELGRLTLQDDQPEVATVWFGEVLNDPRQADPGDAMLHNWVEAVEGVAAVAESRGDVARGARLLGAAAELRRSGNLPFPSRADRDACREAAARYSARFGPAWSESWEAGRRLPPREAIDEALRAPMPT